MSFTTWWVQTRFGAWWEKQMLVAWRRRVAMLTCGLIVYPLHGALQAVRAFREDWLVTQWEDSSEPYERTLHVADPRENGDQWWSLTGHDPADRSCVSTL